MEGLLHATVPACFDESATRDWFLGVWSTSLWLPFLYIVSIFSLQHVMRDRERFRLRGPLIVWNAALSLSSLVGSIVFINYYVTFSRNHGGLHEIFCSSDYLYDRPTFFWLMVITLSKLLELGDTVFIVLRKQKLIFLHWYHHALTLPIVWYGVAFQQGFGFIGPLLNYPVHFIMYGYYGLRAAGFTVPTTINKVITSLQILQMLLGMWVCFYVYSRSKYDVTCRNTNEDSYIMAMAFTYLSYFLLFAKFFYDVYVDNKKRKEL